MKCQKCGNNEVNFHYSSSVNGAVTETHLCSRCATESGYDIDSMFGFGQAVDLGFLMFPFTLRPHTGMIGQRNACDCGCNQGLPRASNVEVDKEISLRRELSAQMRAAVEKEEFEKAAELRDKIRELEAKAASVTECEQTTGREIKCDSETTSQDSPAAQ